MFWKYAANLQEKGYLCRKRCSENMQQIYRRRAASVCKYFTYAIFFHASGLQEILITMRWQCNSILFLINNFYLIKYSTRRFRSVLRTNLIALNLCFSFKCRIILYKCDYYLNQHLPYKTWSQSFPDSQTQVFITFWSIREWYENIWTTSPEVNQDSCKYLRWRALQEKLKVTSTAKR